MIGDGTKYAFVPQGGETFRVGFTLDYAAVPPTLSVGSIARGLVDAADLDAGRRAAIAAWLAVQLQATAP